MAEVGRLRRGTAPTDGGLLIVATDSPLPEDTDTTRERFWRLDEALQPAFISREQTAETMRGMLGYFYRERPPVR